MLSVIVAIYNVEKYIEKTINSILCQTYQDMEIILVDDGSQDQSGAICDRYAELDGRVKVVHKSNGGLSDARNAGIDIAHGEYVTFIDGDDYLHPKMFEVLINNLLETDSDISACGFLTVDEESDPSLELKNQNLEIVTGDEAFYQLERLEITVAWNKIYKKELFHELRYPKGRLHEDEYIIHHLLEQCKRLVISDYKLYFYVVRSGSIMNTMNPKRISDTMGALEERYHFFEKRNDMNLCRVTGNDMINAMIMYEKKAIVNKDPNRKQIHKMVRKQIETILYQSSYLYSLEYQIEARMFLGHPNICFAYRWWRDISHRGIDKIQRVLKMKK